MRVKQFSYYSILEEKIATIVADHKKALLDHHASLKFKEEWLIKAKILRMKGDWLRVSSVSIKISRFDSKNTYTSSSESIYTATIRPINRYGPSSKSQYAGCG